VTRAGRAAVGYLRQWMGHFGALLTYRNTVICTMTVCLAAIVSYYQAPYFWGLGAKWRPYLVPMTELFHAGVYVLLPLATLPLLRERDRLGVRWGNWRVWVVDVAVAYAVIAALIVVFGRGEDFRRMYPQYKPAGEFLSVFLWFQAAQLAYFVGWEFLFRGYMLFGTKKELGPQVAVILQVLPFAILHLRKPELEAIGSILAGFYLGVLALRANSVLPCAILHFLAACTMDVWAVIQNRLDGI